MEPLVQTSEDLAESSHPRSEDQKRAVILGELEKILASRFFQHSTRGKQFLSYVVQQKLGGHTENLKERTIGVAIFQRAADYATGDDPVVRVQAGEVRRRLNDYYQAFSDGSAVRIELPLGSYSPEFRWPQPPSSELSEPIPPPQPVVSTPVRSRRVKPWMAGTLCLLLVVVALLVYLPVRHGAEEESVLTRFWAPIFASPQPVLICLAKGVSYRPAPEVYQRYSRSHPGSFSSEVEKSNIPLPLPPDEKLSWSEMALYPDYGVAVGDVGAAVRISALLGKIGKPDQVRIGANYSYEDLRNSPAVVIGAYNNKWTMDLTSKLHFAFVEENGSFLIREQTPHGRVWGDFRSHPRGPPEDFAVVTRLVDSKTGQFTVTIAGITGRGTEAAGDFVTNPGVLEKGLRSVQENWQNKNLQLVLQITVTDSIPDAARVVASYIW
jgi:hypothetical protein